MDIYLVLPDGSEIKVSMIVPPRVGENVSLSRIVKGDYVDKEDFDFSHRRREYTVESVTWLPMSSSYTFARVVLKEIRTAAT